MEKTNYYNRRKKFDEDSYRSNTGNEYAKNKIKKTSQTKLKTAFIGAIDRFEESFGHLWGHGLDYGELSSEQKRWREVWEHCRDNVLDNGNDQLRSLLKEIEGYNITKNRYHVDIPVN
jgi:hypothetical protein